MASDTDRRGLGVSRELALSDRNLNATLIGLSLAIFTFLLIFLYPRAVSGSLDLVLFQITIGDAVGAAFSFAVSALYNYILLFTTPEHVQALRHRRQAELSFTLGLFLLLLEPTLILYTLNLPFIATGALVLLLGYVLLYTYATRKTIPQARKI